MSNLMPSYDYYAPDPNICGRKVFVFKIMAVPFGHICNGFFVSSDMVLTGGDCVAKFNPSHLYIVPDDNVSRILSVREVKVYSDRENWSERINVALLYVEGHSSDYVIFHPLKVNHDFYEKSGIIYKWSYLPGARSEKFVHHEYPILSHEACARLVGRIEKCKICVEILDRDHSVKPTPPGRFDIGSPLVVRNHEEHEYYFIGIYTGDKSNELCEVQIFQETRNLYWWIYKTQENFIKRNM